MLSYLYNFRFGNVKVLEEFQLLFKKKSGHHGLGEDFKNAKLKEIRN